MLNSTDRATLESMLGDAHGDYDEDFLVRAMETLYDEQSFIDLMSAHLTQVQGVSVDFDDLTSEAYWLVESYARAYKYICNWDNMTVDIAKAILLCGNAELSSLVKQAYLDAIDTHNDNHQAICYSQDSYYWP